VDQREAAVTDGAVGVGGGERVHDRVDAGVARHVRAHLPAHPVSGAHDVADLVGRDGQEPAVRRIGDAVERRRRRSVGLAHEGGAGQDAAVGEDLERADAQPVVAVAEP
jgi:hypothetical protein